MDRDEKLVGVVVSMKIQFVGQPLRLAIRPWLASGALALQAMCSIAADERKPFLFVKTGEKFATKEDAEPTVSVFTNYLGQQLGGTDNLFAPRLFNDPLKAIEFCSKGKPPLGIVTPGFFLTYGKTL